MQQFDPNIPGLIEGDVTTFVVIDPAGDVPAFRGGQPRPRTATTRSRSTWSGRSPACSGRSGLSALGGNWNVQVFAESLGGGPEILLARDDSVAADPNMSDYAVQLTVPPTALAEGDPGSNVSGIYKLVVSVFLNSNLGNPGFDMTGFNEGPIIQVEDPA